MPPRRRTVTQAGVCYSMTLGDSYYADEVVWILCGYVGGAPATDLKFCVTASGCAFEGVDSAPYNKAVDDDFPLAISHAHTPAPTAMPTVSTAPTAAVASVPPSTMPVLASRRPTPAPTAAPAAVPSAQPTGGGGGGAAGAGLAHVVFTSFNVTVKMTVQAAASRTGDSPSPGPAAAAAVTAADMGFVGLAVRRALAVAGDIDVWSVSVPAVVAARPALSAVAAHPSSAPDTPHEAAFNVLASLPRPMPMPKPMPMPAATKEGPGGAAWAATMDRLQAQKRCGRRRAQRRLAGTSTTVSVTCVVEAGAVAPPGQTDAFFKEAMDIAVAVSEGTGALQAYIDTALFVTRAAAYTPSSSASPALPPNAGSGVVIQLVSLTDVAVSPDAWAVAANATTRPVDPLYDLVWPPGHADTGALDKIASAAKFFAYLASQPAAAAAFAVGLVLLCCGGLCCCYCLLTRKPFLRYNPLDGSTSPVLDASRRGLADVSTHSTASAAAAAARPGPGRARRQPSDGDDDDGLDGIEDGDGIELATLRRVAQAAAGGGGGVPVSKQRRRWALPFGGGRKGKGSGARGRGASGTAADGDGGGAEDGTVTVDFNPLRPPSDARGNSGSGSGSGNSGSGDASGRSARVTARGARGSAAAGANWWVRGNQGGAAGDFDFDGKETQL